MNACLLSTAENDIFEFLMLFLLVEIGSIQICRHKYNYIVIKINSCYLKRQINILFTSSAIYNAFTKLFTEGLAIYQTT